MRSRDVLWCHFLIGAFIIQLGTVSASPEKDQLYTHLLHDYVKSIPTPSENKPLAVSFGLGLYRAEIDEDASTLAAQTWFRLMWRDYRLKWDPEQYGGVRMLHIPGELIWLPDVTPYYSVSLPEMARDQPNAVVYNDGTVIYVPKATLHVDCTQEYQHLYTCPITFGAYTYDGNTMDVEFFMGQNFVDAADYVHTRQGWEMVNGPAEAKVKYYPCCPDDPQPIVVFSPTFERRTTRKM